MVNSLTPQSICTDVANGKMSRSLASELLMSLIEGSDDHIMRAESIKAFEFIGIKEEKSFKILENSLLSDESQIVRSMALNIIGKFYLRKGIDSINWIIQHDKSPLIIRTLIDISSENILPKTSKESILKIVDSISSQLNLRPYETRFLIDLEAVFTSDQIKSVINVDIYKKFAKLKTLHSDRWILIKKKRIISLCYNYLNWKYLRNNQYRIKAVSKLKYPDIYLNKLNIFSENQNPAIIPNSISRLEHLKILDLSNNHLRKFPESILSLKNLKILDLSNNNIQTIPNEIKRLRNLTRLLLSEKQIQNIPESISGFLNSLEDFKYL